MRGTFRSASRFALSASLALTLAASLFVLDGVAPAAAAAAEAPAPVASEIKPAAPAPGDDGWFTSWAQSQDRRSGITFKNRTFRMITHLSQGGDELRVRLQNHFGTGPITIDASAVALSVSGGAATVPGTNRALTFDGQASVTIAAGAEVWSDNVALETEAQDDIAVSMFVSGSVIPSLHSNPFRDNYVSPENSGNTVNEQTDEPYKGEKFPWTYFVSAVDVHNTELNGTIVAYGSSVVDGEGSQNCGQACTKFGTDRRWADDLARRINTELPADAQVAVANEGISGTTSAPVCAGGGNDGVNRLDRDVLALHGVTAVIFYYGTNDLAANCNAKTILDSYDNIFQRLRDAGIKVYVTPITPRPSYTDAQNAVRRTVNEFVREGGNCSGTCDAVLDFDVVLQDPANENSIYRPYDTGDGVHANVAGQQAIANSIPLPLLAASGLPDGAPAPELKVLSKYDFEDGFQGWQAGSGVGSLEWAREFANGPHRPFDGDRVLDALSQPVPANQMRNLFVEPAKPLDLTDSKALVAHIDSYGGVGGATGYEAVITLTGTDGDVLTDSFAVSPDQWTELSLDVSEWDARAAVSRIEIGFRALGASGVWVPHFQIDEITWAAEPVAPIISSGAPTDATVGEPYAFMVTASGTPAPTFAVTSGDLPAGLNLDGATGAIEGTPTAEGAASFTVTASNGVGDNASADYIITVGAAQVGPGEPGGPEEPEEPAKPSEPTDQGGQNTSTDDAANGSLAATGADPLPLGVLASLMVLLGAAVIVIRKRRASRRASSRA